MRGIVIISLLVDKEMVFQGLNCEPVELEVGITLFRVGAGVEEDKSVEVEFNPFWSIRILVVFDNAESQFGSRDACILKACQVHLLVLQFRELLVETQNGSEVLLPGRLVSYVLTSSIRETRPGRTFQVEDVGQLVPVVGIVPEIGRVASESELPFGVEPTVET